MATNEMGPWKESVGTFARADELCNNPS